MQPVDPVPQPTPAPRGQRRVTSLWPLALTGALLAGMGAWVGGEQTYSYYVPKLTKLPGSERMNPYERQGLMNAQLLDKTSVTEAQNAALTYGLLGAALGLALGLAGGLARGSILASLVAAVVGLAAGAAAGAGLSLVLVTRVFYPYMKPDSGLTLPFLIHGGIWAPIGAAGGLALGLGLGSWRSIPRAVLGGLIGAVIGTLAFEILNAAWFALIRVESPIPTLRLTRLSADFCVTVCATLGALLGVHERRPRKASVPPPEVA